MREQLALQAQKILENLYEITDVNVGWELPQDPAHGDLATPVCLQISKKLGQSPRDIATALCEQLASHEGVGHAEVAGPGYVNIWLTPAALIADLDATKAACNPQQTRKDENPVIIEYSQPNIAKPLGVHHILTTIIGQVLSNLYEHAGYPVIKWNYIGDWGTQFGKLAVAMEKWGEDKPIKEYTLDELLALYVKFHQEVEKDPTLEDQGREAFRKLEAGDETLRSFWTDIVEVTKASLATVYEELHVSFDLDYGESFYEDKMEPILQEGIEKGVFREGEGGSLIVEFDEDSNMPPYLVRKGDGATLYSTRDIAQMRYRIDEYNPQAIYIVTDIAQKLHFEQLEETCNQLEWELPEFENVLFGRMSFADKSMSTRKGNVLKLEDVLTEAVERADKIIAERGEEIQTDDPKELAHMMGIGAIVHGVLSQNRKMDFVFDWDKVLSFEGNSAPYLQYTHARAKSVLRKADENEEELTFPSDITELTEKERALINTLLRFADVLEEARTAHMPHLLTNYLHTLCQAFNTFYNAEPILTASGSGRALRLTLTALTAQVLKTGAELLTMRVPDRM